jgi:hypothetical protein
MENFEDTLLKKFPNLTPSERKLVDTLLSPDLAWYGPENSDQNDPANDPSWTESDEWERNRRIRGALIAWLCSEPDLVSRIDSSGVGVGAAWIDKLDLSNRKILVPLTLSRCFIAGGIELWYAEAHSLDFGGSKTTYVDARRLIVQNDLDFNEHFEAGGVNLAGAHVVGQLGFKSASLVNLTTAALDLSGAKVDDHVLLTEGFAATGFVDLSGCEILGNFDGSGSKVIGGTIAIRADSAIIHGHVLLKDGFRAEGEVNFAGAVIKGNFVADSGEFLNPSGTALKVDGRITGDLRLRGEFKSRGKVDLVGIKIEGDLFCEGCISFTPSSDRDDDQAFDANGAEITHDVFLRDGIRVRGGVSLFGARIGGDLDCSDGKFVCYPTQSRMSAIDARHATVEGNASFTDSTIDGVVDIEHMTVQGRAHFGGCKFTGQRNGLRAAYSNVTGELFWRNIKNLSDLDKRSEDIGHTELDLRHMQVGVLRDEKASWPSLAHEGDRGLRLDGLVYSSWDPAGSAELTGVSERLEWKQRQPPRYRLRPQPYLQLSKVLRAQGREANALEVLIAKEDARYETLDWRGQLKKWPLKLTMEYGYKPLRALWIAAIFIVLGGILFSWGDAEKAFGPLDNDPSFIPFSGFIYSVENFVPGVHFGLAEHWAPKPNAALGTCRLGSNFGEFLLWYLRVHIALGYVLTILIGAGLTGLTHTE